jgi:hypothetical protein
MTTGQWLALVVLAAWRYDWCSLDYEAMPS